MANADNIMNVWKSSITITHLFCPQSHSINFLLDQNNVTRLFAKENFLHQWWEQRFRLSLIWDNLGYLSKKHDPGRMCIILNRTSKLYILEKFARLNAIILLELNVCNFPLDSSRIPRYWWFIQLPSYTFVDTGNEYRPNSPFQIYLNSVKDEACVCDLDLTTKIDIAKTLRLSDDISLIVNPDDVDYFPKHCLFAINLH